MDRRSIVIAIVIVLGALAFLTWPRNAPSPPPAEPNARTEDAVVETAPVDELPVATVDLDEKDEPEDCDAEADCDG